MAQANQLYYGDNLDILRRYIRDESVDLIYLDPPFNSSATYNVLFAEQNGSRSAAQVKAFEDTWRWDEAAAAAYEEVVEGPNQRVSQAMQAFRTFIGESDMLAYLAMMAPRLIELHRVLKTTGSIYLHCDPTASHYLKMLMDAVFAPKRFQNEIIWCYSQGGRPLKSFPNKHDVIFFYSKGATITFNNDTIRIPYELLSKKSSTSFTKTDEHGRQYKEIYGPGKKKLYRYYEDAGKVPYDWWIDIPKMTGRTAASVTGEYLGYPTQKPEALLERIIKASSNEGNVVLDPFCGCGTAIAVAQKLNRRWIGIDITPLAINLIRHRLTGFPKQETVEGKTYKILNYEVIGEPVTVPDAKTLAKTDPYHFQFWSLGLVGARPAEQKKGADKGIDGRLYFHDEHEGKKATTKQIIFSVKAGHVSVSHLRDLRGVLERERAQIGVLISMEKPTKPMRTEAASAGFYKSPWGSHPVLQILTIEQLLKGKTIDCPPLSQVNVTFKKAPKAKGKKHKQASLLPGHEED